MRTIISLFVCLILGISAFAQNAEPTPWLFRWGYDNTTARAFVPDSFQQKSMLLGFQWAGTRIMDSFLLNNTRANHGYDSASPRRYQSNFINQPSWWDRGGYSIGAWNAPFMNYEPTLYFENPTDTGKILRPGDKSDPIFGFQYAKGTILSDTADENYSRLILMQADKPGYGSDTVLRHLWPQPEFITKTYQKFKFESGQSDNYLGRKWYLAVNLRRLDSTSVNTEGITDTVLSIKIRFKGQNTEGNIKFDSLPDENQIVALNYLENRGRMHRLQFNPPKTDSMVITNRMIPAYPTAGYKDITVKSAFFTYLDIERDIYPFGRDSLEIDSIDIIVSYFGHLDVCLDYVRIESINAHYLLTGNLDTIATRNEAQGRGFRTYYTDPEFPNPIDNHKEEINDIGNIIQSSIDSMRAKSRDWQDASLFRFYFQDIECTNYYWWGPQRYMNLATNGMFVTRDLLRHPCCTNTTPNAPTGG